MLLKPGQMFGDYFVVQQLGKGGMAEVWLLEIESRREFCAVKVLDPEKSADHVMRRRFLSEAKLGMEFSHPNVIRVYDIGEDPVTGLCYILMEYAPRGTLADWIRKVGRIPVAEATTLIRDIALLMETVKAKGIVHRDIKPSNILFADDGSFRLSDLGTARVNVVAAQPGLAPEITAKIGSFIGTPAYMAPEQMIDPRGVDYRADIYSLGVVFYEMLLGRHPYANLNNVQVMARAVTGEAIPDIRKADPSIPAVVAKIIQMMCEPKRENRADSPLWIADCCNRVLEKL